MEISFKGYEENAATFIADNTVSEGDIVSIKSSGTVKKAVSGDAILGVCLSLRDGYAVVQLTGYVEVKNEGTITVGNKQLSCAGSNKVAAANAGKFYTVIYVGTGVIGLIL